MPSEEPRPLVVFDVDGVLADVAHRLHHVQGRRKDWAAFFAAAADDPPLPEGVALARASAEDCDVVYLTGRPTRLREDTLAWLRRHGLPDGELVMRPESDRRPARVVKPPLLRRVAAGRVVAVVVDDDPQVCDAYERAGHRVLRATWATPQPAQQEALQEAQERSGRT